MPLLRMIFFAGLVFIGGVAVFIGIVVMATSWQNGAISLSYAVDGKTVTETITKAGNSARFWRFYVLTGAAPAVLGLAAMIYGVRTLRR